MGQWLKRGSLSKQCSTTGVSTGATDVVSESQRFMSPSSIDSSRTAESSKKTEVQLFLFVCGVYYAGNGITPDALCVLYNRVLPNSSTLPAKLRTRHDTNHPAYKQKVLVL
jgi:hypothetical protein